MEKESAAAAAADGQSIGGLPREREGERPRCGARPPSASVHPSIGSARASTRGREGEGVRAAGRAPAPMQLVVEIAQKSVSENAALNVKMLGMSRTVNGNYNEHMRPY